MKYIAFLLSLLVACTSNNTTNTTVEKVNDQVNENDLIGSWTFSTKDSIGFVTGLAIVTDGYYSVSRFDLEGSRFLYTLGGSWELDSNVFVETYEFNTLDSTKVGQTDRFQIEVKDNLLIFSELGETWEKADDGTPGALSGAWLITGRQRDGQISRRVPGVRKTMKILSGTRFQWIAYNIETAQFFGTGGGAYTTTDSLYTENIQFFSRNPDRVGASLEFQYSIDSGEWHHSGFSSKGDPMYEIWTPRAMLDKVTVE